MLVALAGRADGPSGELPPLPDEEWFAAPRDLGPLFTRQDRATEASSQLHLEPITKPIDSIVQTPWKTPAFDMPVQPGVVMRRKQKLPWGLEAEWRLGVAARPTAVAGDLAEASLWSVKTAIGDRFFVYLHDKGSGFVKYFGDSLSVYGRIGTTADRRTASPTVHVGAARSF